ncbi:hypothetical protein E4O05_01445 [Treponema sp. OMZ 787]|uniref:hypothetical protein n=1 Tax=Treponema sp. OMZ 787 TaxID=2563669 RepID=UPI0020A2FD1D|nr:hypothetical protein [Treponema sp. OMZ 787]UTC62606.1 hypothetical protein E4O05_01445 [Treponema sp. OMZ 787]
MKRIVFVGLMMVLLSGCGKVEKGVITIENKSSYPVEISLGQNYSSERIELQPSTSIKRPWEVYCICVVEKPSLTLLKKQQTKEKIVISNTDELYTYKVSNRTHNLTMLKMLDEKQSILAGEDGILTSSIHLNLGDTTIHTFSPLSIKNIIFDKGIPFNIGEASYYPIEKKGEFYYFNKIIDGKLDTKRINIDLVGYEIIITN